MYDVIKRFAENENENGLILVDMPTGSGKTYSAIEFIYNSCMNPDNKDRKYFFVTTMKKNLPIEDIRKRFEDSGRLDLYKEKVLFIDSNIDSVIDGWSYEVERAIPIEIKKTDEYKEFQQNVNFVKRQREDKNPVLRDYLPSIEKNLRDKSEPNFRRLLSNMLSKEYITVEKKLIAIKTENKWEWIAKIYPAVFTRDRQVLFMSMDKFLSRNTTIVEPSYMFYNSDVIKNALIFIDEFDATKKTILDNIINNGLRDRINYIELFKDIYAALHTDSFPVELTTPSKERMEGSYSWQSLESVVDGIREKADYLYKTYNLQYKHRTIGDSADNYQNYLFQDHQFHSILNDKNSYINMFSDDKRRINSIGFSQSKPEKENNNIQNMLGQLRGFITYFQGAVNILAINYMQQKKERKQDGEDVFTMESSIRSVLALFRLNRDSVDYLTGQIMMSSRKVKGEIEPANFDLFFYERGFRYYAFENNTEHDMQSQIMMYSFQTTPEKILLRFCEKAKVIGISATATLPTVIGNFDVNYLKDKMQKIYVEVTDEERYRLNESFVKQQSGYKDINIHAELLGSGEDYSTDSWKSVFKNEELVFDVYNSIQRLFGENDDKNNYKKNRYLRVALAFKQFVIHEDIRSFLCVLNKHPRSKDKDLDREVLFDIFSYIAKENNWNGYDNKNIIVYLDGSEFEDNKTRLIERLASGEKLFVISVYQTIGAGQNLQYPVPKIVKDNIVKINKRELKDEKDFDAIYLAKPTNLVVQLNDNIPEFDFVKYLYQMEFLQEAAELSAAETMKNIKIAFKTLMMGKHMVEKPAYVYSKKSVVLLGTRCVIQAIGRICRTNQKNKNIYIFADDEIVDSIDVSVIEGRSFNPEFLALINKIKEVGAKTPENESLEYEASLRSVRVNKEMKNILNNDWTEAKVNKWKDLRKLVLVTPTGSAKQASKNFVIKNYYIHQPEKANKYYYSQEEDFNNVSVSFTKDSDHTLKVSEEGTKLKEMLRIPGVKELFDENGWATSFEPNEYIMTPPLWNNIYKGALGEVVGKYILERFFAVEVSEINDPDIFELFDYEIAGVSMYVDFKNWHEGITDNKESVLKKIAEKAKKCDCRCVAIINIIAERQWDVSETEINGIHIVSIPRLMKEIDGEIKLDEKAADVLKRCFDEYKY